MLVGRVQFDNALPAARRALLTDPQTGGGLLLAVDAAAAEAILQSASATGEHWSVIGRVRDGGVIEVDKRSSLPSV